MLMKDCKTWKNIGLDQRRLVNMSGDEDETSLKMYHFHAAAEALVISHLLIALIKH